MRPDRGRLAAGSALLFELPQSLAEARLLAVDGANLLQQTAMRIVETLDDRGHYVHVVAQAGDLGDEPLQRLTDIGQVDDGSASILAHDGISALKPSYE